MVKDESPGVWNCNGWEEETTQHAVKLWDRRREEIRKNLEAAKKVYEQNGLPFGPEPEPEE